MKKYVRIGLLVLIAVMAIGLTVLFSWITPGMLYATIESDYDQGAPKIFEWLVGDRMPDINLDEVPEILVSNEGERVLNSEDYSARKEEMMDYFYSEVYGVVPDIAYTVSFTLLDEDEHHFGGTAIRQQVKMTVKTEMGESDALLLLYMPKSEEPVPVFAGLNFKGNTFLDDSESIMTSYGSLIEPEDIEERRGERYSRWQIQSILENGYGFITACANDFSPDDKNLYDSRLIEIFDNGVEFKTVSAWAFGLSRIIDFIESHERLDESKIITVGHSRMGKVSLWTAAQDDRVALAISNGSGNTGAALSRGSVGENIKFINGQFPHWFLEQYKVYAGREEEMPFDQHMLLASIVPRKVYVASSTNDLWANPVGEYLSLLLASEAYSLFGLEDAMQVERFDEESYHHSEFFGYHIKDDRHRISEVDWNYFIKYADKYIK